MYISPAYAQNINFRTRSAFSLSDRSDDLESDDGNNKICQSPACEDDENGSSTETDAGEEDAFDITDYQPIDLSNLKDPEEIWGDPYEALGIDPNNPLAGEVGIGTEWTWDEEECTMSGCNGRCKSILPDNWPSLEGSEKKHYFQPQPEYQFRALHDYPPHFYSSITDRLQALHPRLSSMLQEHLRYLELQKLVAASRDMNRLPNLRFPRGDVRQQIRNNEMEDHRREYIDVEGLSDNEDDYPIDVRNREGFPDSSEQVNHNWSYGSQRRSRHHYIHESLRRRRRRSPDFVPRSRHHRYSPKSHRGRSCTPRSPEQ